MAGSLPTSDMIVNKIAIKYDRAKDEAITVMQKQATVLRQKKASANIKAESLQRKLLAPTIDEPSKFEIQVQLFHLKEEVEALEDSLSVTHTKLEKRKRLLSEKQHREEELFEEILGYEGSRLRVPLSAMRTQSDPSIPHSISLNPLGGDRKMYTVHISPSPKKRMVNNLVKRVQKYKGRAFSTDFLLGKADSKRITKKIVGQSEFSDSLVVDDTLADSDTDSEGGFAKSSEPVVAPMNAQEGSQVAELSTAALEEIDGFEQFIRSYFRDNKVVSTQLPWLFSE